MAASRLAETRQRVLAESLDAGFIPKFGYFGFPPTLAIGDDSLAHTTERVIEPEGEGEKPFLMGPGKKGVGLDAVFMHVEPLCNGDLYVDPSVRTRKPRVRHYDPEAAFKPPGLVKGSLNTLGVEWLPSGAVVRDPKDAYAEHKDVTGARNMLISGPKKGGGGILTPGVLLSPFPEHVPDDYDAPRKQRKAELEEHRSKLQEMPFRGMHYGDRTFHRDADFFCCDQPRGLPRVEEPFVPSYKPEQAFRPSNPGKSGLDAPLNAFPEHIPDPIAGPRGRLPPPEVEPPPAFRPAQNCVQSHPTPSVVFQTRNLRAEFPKSFARPAI